MSVYKPHDQAEFDYGGKFQLPLHDDFSEESGPDSTCHDESEDETRFRPERGW